MTEVKSFKFRDKEIKYYAYELPIHTAQYHMENELAFIEKNLYLNTNDVFVDVGSAFGSWTLPALSMGATAIAIDPSPIFNASISNNIVLNGWSERCTIIHGAAADIEDMWVEYHFLSGSSFKPQKVEGDLPSEQPLLCKTMTLDLLDPFVTDKVNLIKIDVEGAEMQVLAGAKKLLEKHHPNIILEHHQDISGPILLPKGYKIKEIDKRWLLSPIEL